MTPTELRERRLVLGLGKATLAKLAGVAWTTIQRIEEGDPGRHTQPSTLRLLDDVLSREERKQRRRARRGGEA